MLPVYFKKYLLSLLLISFMFYDFLWSEQDPDLDNLTGSRSGPCVGGNEDEIRSLVSSGRILGQSQLTFLTRANRADIAIHFIHVRNSTIHWLLFFLFFRIRINFPDLIPTLSFDRKTFPVPESLRNSYTVHWCRKLCF